MALKKLVCDQVKFAPLNTIDSIDAGVVTFKAGFDWILLKSKRADLSEILIQSESGDSVNQILTFAMAIDADDMNLIKKPSVYYIVLNNGTEFVWGSLDNPVRTSKLSDAITSGSIEVIRHVQNFEFG